MTMGIRWREEVQTSALSDPNTNARARARPSFCLSKRVSMSLVDRSSSERRRGYHRVTSLFASSSSTWEASSKPQAASRISL